MVKKTKTKAHTLRTKASAQVNRPRGRPPHGCVWRAGAYRNTRDDTLYVSKSSTERAKIFRARHPHYYRDYFKQRNASELKKHVTLKTTTKKKTEKKDAIKLVCA